MDAQSNNIETRMGITLRDIGIPPRPSILNDIDREMAKHEPDFTHLARILGSDVALGAALLKSVNSPFFGFDKKVRSIQEALLVLGLKLVTSTIAGMSLRQAFRHVPDMERFWDASASTARVSGWLARRLHRSCWVRPEDAYTFGLFRDCGIPILMGPFPDYRALLGVANSERVHRFTDIENDRLSVNHADVGAMLAESWQLPDDIVQAIRYHHDLPGILDRQSREFPAVVLPTIAIAQLAEHLIYLRTGMSKTCEWDKIAEEGCRVLGIEPEMITTLAEEADAAIHGEFD